LGSKLLVSFEIGSINFIFGSSVLLGILLGVVASFTNPEILFAVFIYFSLLIIHEMGHLIFAKMRGLKVNSISISLLHGQCRYKSYGSSFDDYVVAWGGVALQALFFIPLLVNYYYFSMPQHWLLTVPTVILGFYSLLMALFNLLPIPGLDGSKCWKVFPELFKQRKNSHRKSRKEKRNHLKSVK
jgi:Zn-dependent protease